VQVKLLASDFAPLLRSGKGKFAALIAPRPLTAFATVRQAS
jgi:hypothetical protein